MLFRIPSLHVCYTEVLFLGPLLGYPVTEVRVELHECQVQYGTSLPMITACVSECIYQALQEAAPVLLEPVMQLEVRTTVFVLPTKESCLLVLLFVQFIYNASVFL